MRDWIAPVEAAYALDVGVEAWVGHVLTAVQPLLGDMTMMGACVLAGPAWAMEIAAGVPSAPMPRFERLIQRAAREALSTAFGAGRPLFCSLSEQVFTRFPGSDRLFAEASGLSDCLYLVAPAGNGSLFALGVAQRACRPTTRAERRTWSRIAAHIGAGLRIRGALERSPGPDPTEAVLDPDAKLLDASAAAAPAGAREALRESVKRRERARTHGTRSDPDESLTLWEGLVAGRWSLVDRFESDGKRFVIAYRNDPDLGDPRGLTHRERQVAEYVGLGRSSKEIAYLLGIGEPAVSNAIARAIRKLGLGGRAELASFFAPDGLRAQLVEMEIAGEPLAAGAAPLLSEGRLARLSDAEREIAREALQGWTTRAIAERRGTSVRTVETQLKSIYAKLDVSSRVELAAKVSA